MNPLNSNIQKNGLSEAAYIFYLGRNGGFLLRNSQPKSKNPVSFIQVFTVPATYGCKILQLQECEVNEFGGYEAKCE